MQIVNLCPHPMPPPYGQYSLPGTCWCWKAALGLCKYAELSRPGSRVLEDYPKQCSQTRSESTLAVIQAQFRDTAPGKATLADLPLPELTAGIQKTTIIKSLQSLHSWFPWLLKWVVCSMSNTQCTAVFYPRCGINSYYSFSYLFPVVKTKHWLHLIG